MSAKLSILGLDHLQLAIPAGGEVRTFPGQFEPPAPPPNHPISSGYLGWLGGGAGWCSVILIWKCSRALEFYRDLLGFKEVAKPAALAGQGGVWLMATGIDLHLGVDPNFTPARKAHPAFIVSDLSAFRHCLEAAGHVVVDHDKPLQGYHRFHTHDPFGNRIELMERAGAA